MAVVEFQRVGGVEGRWVSVSSQRMHSHDVRAMECLGKVLVTGGVDTRLGVYSTDRFAEVPPRKIAPFPQRPWIHVSRSVQSVLYSQCNRVKATQCIRFTYVILDVQRRTVDAGAARQAAAAVASWWFRSL